MINKTSIMVVFNKKGRLDKISYKVISQKKMTWKWDQLNDDVHVHCTTQA